MRPEEADLATSVYAAIQRSSNYSTRSLQSRNFQVGVSDLGWCSERTRRMLLRETPDDRDMLPAWIGTAIGDHAEQAIVDMWPHAIRQADITVHLTGDRGTYAVNGHPDVVVDNTVIDVKTSRGLGKPRRTGPNQQQQYQRHCYALGAYEAGLLPGPLEDVKVANVWIDRSADERDVHVHMENYNPEVVQEAAWWLEDVIYAYTHNEEARKEPPREMCEKTCGFYSTCRALDTDVEGLLSDDGVLAAVDMYREAGGLEKQARMLKDQAKAALDGITGSTGEYLVRWTRVNTAEVHYTREGYDRLDVRRIK